MHRNWAITATCAVLVLLGAILCWKRAYLPDLLMVQHAQLGNRCVACHQPFVGLTNAACIDCHGNFVNRNPHGMIRIVANGPVLLPGHRLHTFADHLACLTCHTEHQGRIVDVRATAAVVCTSCHFHPAIQAVSAHLGATMTWPKLARRLLKNPFNHRAHKVMISFESPPGSAACGTCHVVRPAPPGRAATMFIKFTGCLGSNCHANPQDSYIGLPAALGTAPALIPYSSAIEVRHLNAAFTHSLEHVEHPCAQCHLNIMQSMNPDDANARAVTRCFACHAHQPPAPGLTRTALNVGGGTAWAAPIAASDEPVADRIVACGQCHLFHTHGEGPRQDFPTVAPQFPPHTVTPVSFTLPIPSLSRAPAAGGWLLSLQPWVFSPWLVGSGGLLILGLGVIGFIKLAPRRELNFATDGDVAPQRMAEYPVLDDLYQTNIARLHIVGEAAGTASINFAMRSGRQVIDGIRLKLKQAAAPLDAAGYEVAIVGCGPAGLGATAAAKAAGLKYITLEKLTTAATIRLFPRAKFVQGTPIEIAEYGSLFLEGDNTKEGLLSAWQEIIHRLGLVINEREEVLEIKSGPDSFALRTAAGHQFQTRYVVLAIGVRGNPRRLGLPGETSERVFYNLVEPGEFKNRKILVAGGGNAGAEVVQALAAPELGNVVSYTIRDAVLHTVTRENAEKIAALQQSQAITLYPASALSEIKAGSVVLTPVAGAAQASAPPAIELDNEVIFAMIGAELPTRFLAALGVRMRARK